MASVSNPSVASNFTTCKALSSDDISHYFIKVDTLGSGAFGEAYVATPTALALSEIGDLPQHVAIKRAVLPRDPKTGQIADFSRRVMTNEINSLQRVKMADMNYSVQFYGCFGGKDSLYLVMELAPGKDLEDIIEDHFSGGADLTLSEKLTIIKEVALAIQEFHDNSFTHRDLKPENTFVELVRQKGQPTEVRLKLLDYGFLCSLIGVAKNEPSCFDHRGTPDFMDPQIYQPNGDWGKLVSADWWAFGQIAHEVLTGVTSSLGYTIVRNAKGKAIEEKANYQKPDPKMLVERLGVPAALANLLESLLNPYAPVVARPDPSVIMRVVLAAAENPGPAAKVSGIIAKSPRGSQTLEYASFVQDEPVRGSQKIEYASFVQDDEPVAVPAPTGSIRPTRKSAKLEVLLQEDEE